MAINHEFLQLLEQLAVVLRRPVRVGCEDRLALGIDWIGLFVAQPLLKGFLLVDQHVLGAVGVASNQDILHGRAWPFDTSIAVLGHGRTATLTVGSVSLVHSRIGQHVVG